jgi:hypothetical protein
MNEAERKALDSTLAQMLKPVRNVPFSIVIKAMCGHDVIPLDKSLEADQVLIAKLTEAVQLCADELTANPIRRPRPNEVGNDVEPYVLRAIPKVGLRAFRPTSKTGAGQATGYPDILLQDVEDRYTYLECKISAQGAPLTTMRSFYLSPSEAPKVSRNARHLLLMFAMEATAIPGSRDSSYVPRSFKLVDLHDLACNVKYEFNSDNRSLYAPSLIVSQGVF